MQNEIAPTDQHLDKNGDRSNFTANRIRADQVTSC